MGKDRDRTRMMLTMGMGCELKLYWNAHENGIGVGWFGEARRLGMPGFC